MRHLPLKTSLHAVALLSCAVAASAHSSPNERIAGLLESGSAALGTPMSAPLAQLDEPAGAPAPGGAVSGTAEQPVETVENLVNFEYSELVSRPERLRVTIGRGRRRRTVPANSGVIEADRVNQGQISEIVLHASLGAGACEGTVNHLLSVRQAAHFMICRNGRIYQMVEIDNIASHVRNDAVRARSVGIETESGHLPPLIRDRRGRLIRKPNPTDEETFWTEDWSPSNYWPMYASMATLIRAIHREARVPRDLAHIRTHEVVDSATEDPNHRIGSHTDPGGVFDGSRGHAYPEFTQRYGATVSPYQWLMRLVNDDTPPAILAVLSTPVRYQVRDTDNLGLAHVRLWTVDATGKAQVKVSEWLAQPGTFPDAAREVTAPSEPGRYRIVARDLVGNITGAEFTVLPANAGGGNIASALTPMSYQRLSDLTQMAFLETEGGRGGAGGPQVHAFLSE